MGTHQRTKKKKTLAHWELTFKWGETDHEQCKFYIYTHTHPGLAKKEKKIFFILFFLIPFNQGLISGSYYLSNKNQATGCFHFLEDVRGQGNAWNFRSWNPSVSSSADSWEKANGNGLASLASRSVHWQPLEEEKQGFGWDPGIWGTSGISGLVRRERDSMCGEAEDPE